MNKEKTKEKENIISKENHSKEKNNYSKNRNLEKTINNIVDNKKKESENCCFNDGNFDSNDNQKVYNNKSNININDIEGKKSLKRIFDSSLKNQNHKEGKKPRGSNKGDEYDISSNLNINKNEKRGTAYYHHKNDDIDLNKINYIVKKNYNSSRKNKYVLDSSTKIDTIKNNDLLRTKEEQNKSVKKSFISTSSNTDNNAINNNNKSLKTETISTCQNRPSETKNKKTSENSDKFSDLNTLSIENENGYNHRSTSKLVKIPPSEQKSNLNLNINIESNNSNNNNIIENDKIKKEGSVDRKKDENKNNEINCTNNNFNKKRYSQNETNKVLAKDNNDNKIEVKKYSISVQKNDNKNKLSRTINNSNYNNKEESKNELKNSIVKSIRAKTNENQNNGKNCYSRFNINSKLREIKPISVINYKSNNTNNTSYIINTPNKKEIKFEFLKRNNKFNKNKYANNKAFENLSFNSDIKHCDKNYSFLNDKQINEIKVAEKNNSLDVKNKKIIHKKRKPINNFKKDYILSDTKVEVSNNNILYSINYRNKHNTIKSSVENSFEKKKEYKNKNNNKDGIDYNNNENYNNGDIIYKRRNRNNYFNNNCIKIISHEKKNMNSQKKKISTTFYNVYNSYNPNGAYNDSDSYMYPPKINNDMIINVKRIKNQKDMKQIEQKVQNNQEQEEIKNKDKDKDYELENKKYHKDKNDNVKVRMNIINTKMSKRSITQLNNTDKSINSEKYNKNYCSRYDINSRGDKTERNDKSANHQTYTYIRRNMNEDISNKYFNEGKKTKYFKTRILNGEKKINEHYENNNTSSCDKKNNNDKNKNKNKWTINIMNKINISNFPSITIDMNILNKHNKEYLKLYDAIKNKL